MNILLIGDVFGKPGRRAIMESLPALIKNEALDFVIANGENLAGGKGMTPDKCEELFAAGVDIITSGNHVRDQKEIDPALDSDSRLLRPLNYPPHSMPGRGWIVRAAKNGVEVGVINAIGRVHMGEIPSPFEITLGAVTECRKTTSIIIVDFHAEATSEKRALGWYLNGKVSAVLGTHTHVQTADEEILSEGTAYISDVGMTGPYDSVIGLRKDLALERFVLGIKGKFDVGKNDVRFCGAIVDVDSKTGRARSIRRVRQDLGTLAPG